MVREVGQEDRQRNGRDQDAVVEDVQQNVGPSLLREQELGHDSGEIAPLAATPASAVSTTETVQHAGLPCGDWGQTAVRNWLSARCPAPAGSITYRTYLRGGGGVWIRGVQGGNGCTSSPDVPRGKYNFRPACDMHDYAFWLMKHGQLKQSQRNLDEINSWFYTVLRYGVCGTYRGSDRSECERIAYSYMYAVQLFAGSPVAPV